MEIVPNLKHNSLITASKFADANYITVLTPTEVLFYDGQELTMKLNKEAILQGWQEKSGLWYFPLSDTTPPAKNILVPLMSSIEPSSASRLILA